MSDVFNPIGAQNSPKTNSEIYKVNYKEGKGQIYTSIVRFIPWVTDPSKCIVEKQVSFVKNPSTHMGMYVDDPRSIGEFSPVTDMFFKFYNTKNDAYIKFAKEHLSSKQQYASLVQIIKDEQHPELVGQIKVFIYGKKVWQKLYDEEHPVMGVGVNPFHPINGKFFYIHCCEQSGFNNYDQSKFLDTNGNSGMYIAVGNTMQQVTAETNQNAIIEFLKTNSPDLSKYAYQPWTQEQAAFVETALQLAASCFNTGTFPTNNAVLNGAAPMQTVAQPTFPGVSPAMQPMNPQTGMQMQTGMPQAPSIMNPTMGVVQESIPQVPQGMGNIPGLNNPPTPASSPMAGFNLGGAPMNSAPNMGTTEPGITGINLPPTINGEQPAAPVAGGSIGGNIEDILNNI